jgi:exodeoxyribonuclease X
MKVIILDTETTGLPPKGEACEIAWFPIQLESLLSDVGDVGERLHKEVDLIEYFHQTFMPIGDFHPKASACNGFTKENLAGSPCISTFVFPTGVKYMIGHNIMFDYDILKKPKGVKLICTKELSIKYLTKASGAGTKGVNTLTGLIERYYPEEAAMLLADAHSALQDCKLTYLILLKVLEAAPELDSFEKLAMQCKQPSWKVTGIRQDEYSKDYYFTFGKHENELVMDVLKKERSYLTWIVEESTMNQGLKDWVKDSIGK